MMAGARGLIPALAVGAALLAPVASAHTVGWSVDTESAATVLSFAYAGDEPMVFADITVTAPDGRVWQRGRADREGRFAVAIPPDAGPDEAWTVKAMDGEGHALTATVTPGSAARSGEVRAATTRLIGWLALGTSLLCVALGGVLVERRSQRAEARG